MYKLVAYSCSLQHASSNFLLRFCASAVVKNATVCWNDSRSTLFIETNVEGCLLDAAIMRNTGKGLT